MATPIVYVICDQNCKFEGMTKEQILAAIVQAVSTGEIGNVDTGFVQTIKTINGLPLKFFVGEQSAYDALSAEEKHNLFAIITNDTTKEALLSAIETLQNNCEGILNGTVIVPKAACIGNGSVAFSRKLVWGGEANIAKDSQSEFALADTDTNCDFRFIVIEYSYQRIDLSNTGNFLAIKGRTQPIGAWDAAYKYTDYVDIPIYHNNEDTVYIRVFGDTKNTIKLSLVDSRSDGLCRVWKIYEET